MNRKVALIAGGAAAVILALWFFFLFKPQTTKISDAEARQEAAASQNTQLGLELARLQEADDRRTELVADQERLRAAVPDDADLAQFLLDANDAATAAGIDFVSISPAPPAASDDPTKPTSIGLSIEIEGGYFQVLDYVNRLNGLERVVVIDTVSATPTGDDGERLAVSLSARMFTTALPAGTEGAAADPSTTTTTAPSTAPVAEGEGTPTTTAPAAPEGTAALGATATEENQ